MFKALIFDCDGTLVDSEPLGIAALLDEAALLGFEMDREYAFTLLKGKKMSTCVEILEARFMRTLPAEFVPNVRSRMADSFSAHLREIDGARELLTGLQIPYCIASNGPLEKIELTLTVSGLAEVLNGPIFSAYEVGHWKPSPELFLHAAREMGVDPDQCAVVEDSEPGIEAGLAAGMTVFALRQSPADSSLEARKNLVYIDGLSDLPRYL